MFGDLVDHLEIKAQNNRQKVEMGGELRAPSAIKNLKLNVKFKSPSVNNNGDRPVVDHIDLIAGEITGKIDPTDPGYTNATNPTAKVIATFSRRDVEKDKEGFSTIVYHIKDVDKNMYFRLRGTNLTPNTPSETDAFGNPLADSLINTAAGPAAQAEAAWKDLWFYSNPIFVYVK